MAIAICLATAASVFVTQLHLVRAGGEVVCDCGAEENGELHKETCSVYIAEQEKKAEELKAAGDNAGQNDGQGPVDVTEDPSDPAVNPDDPAVDPDDPAVNPDDPTVNPDDPAVNPDDPAVNPDDPAVNPDDPAVNPDDPAVDPADPAVDPADPAVDPADPAVDPADPAVDPADPAVDPADPAVDPADPAVDPADPADDPVDTEDEPEVPAVPSVVEEAAEPEVVAAAPAKPIDLTASQPVASEPEDITKNVSERINPRFAEQYIYSQDWENYGKAHMRGNVQAAAEYYELRIALKENAAEVVEALGGNIEDALIPEGSEHFSDVLALYAIITDKTDDYPYSAIFTDREEEALFDSLYWRMNPINGMNYFNRVIVTVDGPKAEEIGKEFGFTKEDLALLKELQKQGPVVDELVEKSIFSTLTDREFSLLNAKVPTDISPQRRAVLLTGTALAGKVDYFWGGKSAAYGWDERWGSVRTVTSEGSSTTGTAQTFGLDCSGFVSWTFLNANSGKDAISHGTSNQWSDSYEVKWEDAVPGDIVFYHAPAAGVMNHVGIVLLTDENGPTEIIQCGGGGVQVTTTAGFQHVRRPYVYQEREVAEASLELAF